MTTYCRYSHRYPLPLKLRDCSICHISVKYPKFNGVGMFGDFAKHWCHTCSWIGCHEGRLPLLRPLMLQSRLGIARSRFVFISVAQHSLGPLKGASILFRFLTSLALLNLSCRCVFFPIPLALAGAITVIFRGQFLSTHVLFCAFPFHALRFSSRPAQRGSPLNLHLLHQPNDDRRLTYSGACQSFNGTEAALALTYQPFLYTCISSY